MIRRAARCQATRCRLDDSPRPVEPGRVLCGPCTDRMAAAMVEVGRAWHRLDAALAPGSTTAGTERVSGQPERPLPVRPAVVELRGQIRHDLAWWAARVAVERGIEPPPTDTPAVVGRWLARHAEWLAGTDDAPALADVMAEHRRAARAALDIPADRTRFPVGPCPATLDDGQRCPGTVTAHIPRDETEPALLKCRICDGEWDTRQWLRVGKQIMKAAGYSTPPPPH